MISRCPSCAAQVDEESSRCPTCSWDFRERKRLPSPGQSEVPSHDKRPAAQAASQEVPERLGAKIPELKFLPFSESVTESKPKRSPAGCEPPQTAVRRNPGPENAPAAHVKRLSDKPLPAAPKAAPKRKSIASIPWIGMAAAFIILMIVGALLSRRAPVGGDDSRDIRNVQRAAFDPYHPEGLPHNVSVQMGAAAPLPPAAPAAAGPGSSVILLRSPIPAPLAPLDNSR